MSRKFSRKNRLIVLLLSGGLALVQPSVADEREATNELSTEKVLDSDPRWAIQWAWSEQEVATSGENFWPQYRGPQGDGIAASSARPPENWSETENVAWKMTLNGKAWSSPVVWGNHVFLTNASEDGLSMSACCLELDTGKVLWDREIFKNSEVQPDYHEFNSYASPTPVLDGEHVYVSYGAYGTACLSRESGEMLWERRDLPCNHYRGAGSSPILFRSTLIFHMDGYDQQYLVALDRKTGSTVWRTDRVINYGTDDGDQKKAYGTPHVISVEKDGTHELQLLSPAAKAILAYSPTTGQELWKVHYSEHSASLRPLFDGQCVYTSTGFSRGKLLAINPTGHGDVTESGVLWSSSRAIGAKPSPLLVNHQIISLEDRGVLSAISKTDGSTLWQKRLGGDFSSSPILAGGMLYCFDEQGKCHVVSPEGDVLAVNQLDAGCLASPAAVGPWLIVRTRNAIYAIKK